MSQESSGEVGLFNVSIQDEGSLIEVICAVSGLDYSAYSGDSVPNNMVSTGHKKNERVELQRYKQQYKCSQCKVQKSMFFNKLYYLEHFYLFLKLSVFLWI